MIIQGVYSALVTPFANGSVDFTALGNMIEFQLANGIAGFVPVGTTGESPTLTTQEHISVIDFVCRKVDKRALVIAGTGANATQEAIELTKAAKNSGADATLQVTPYYNRPSQEGIFRHMAAIAEEGGLPLFLYNIPGRTGATLELQTVKRIFEAAPTVGIKEAAGSVERVSALKQICPQLAVVSGDDGLTLPMLSVGACGVISVASNVVPREMTDMVNAALKGDFQTALAIHNRLWDLFKHLFIETNPVPVKAALADMKQIFEEYRLPLCAMSDTNRATLRATLQELTLI